MKILVIISILFTVGCSAASTKSTTTLPTKISQTSVEVSSETKPYTKEDLPLVEIANPERKPGEFGEMQTRVKKHDPAPFEGVLLNPSAIAYIISEYEAQKQRSIAALEKQRDQDLNKINLEVSKLQIHLDSINKQHKILINGKDEEINRCNTIKDKLINDDPKKRLKTILITTSVSLALGAAGFAIGAIAY